MPDVEALRPVVKFDVPQLPEDYIHRVGRTAPDEAAIQHWRTVRWSHIRWSHIRDGIPGPEPWIGPRRGLLHSVASRIWASRDWIASAVRVSRPKGRRSETRSPCPLLRQLPLDQRLTTELGVEEMHDDGLRRRRAIRERRDAEPPIGPPHERRRPGIATQIISARWLWKCEALGASAVSRRTSAWRRFQSLGYFLFRISHSCKISPSPLPPRQCKP